MKVLYIETKGNKLNGSQQSLLNLIAILKAKGVEPYLGCHEQWELLEVAKQHGIETVVIPHKSLIIQKQNISLVKYLKYPAKRIYNLLQAERAACFLKKAHIDVVHINTTLASEIWARAAQKCKIPYVWHIREFLDADHNRVLLNKKHTYRMIAQAGEVIAISEAVKTHWDKILKKTCRLIYNGLPLQNYYESEFSKFEAGGIRYLIVGRVNGAKGQIDAVKAVEQVVRTGRKNIHLTIVGYRGFDEYELKLKKYVESQDLCRYIELVDYTYNMAAYRQRSDIGLMCSRAEAFGRVTVEYMMAGLLVFGTNSGGTPELIKNGVDGFLYEFGDSDALARLMIYADENREEMKEMAKRGQRKAINEFTIERTAEEVLSVYKSIGAG